MKTKAEIVQRLIDNDLITAEEAVVLLKETVQTIGFKQYPSQLIQSDGKVPYHTICGCNVCQCVMGNKMVDPNSSGNWTTDNTFTTSNEQGES